MNKSDVEFLRTAIEVARSARDHGNHPFGAVLVDAQGKLLLRAENTVNTEQDSTGHAETNLVRLATKKYSSDELQSCTLYTSTEPCAMCAGAIYWSNIRRVVYALSEVVLYEIIGPSADQLLLPSREVFAHTSRAIEVDGPAAELDEAARAVHEGFWK